jgi:hypothetical protein
MLKNSGWPTGHRRVLKTQNLQTSKMEFLFCPGKKCWLKYWKKAMQFDPSCEAYRLFSLDTKLKFLSEHRPPCLRFRMFFLSSFMQIPGWQRRSRPLPSTFFLVHYSPVIVPFHDMYSDTQTASLNKHSISNKRNDRPSAVTGTLWSLPRAIGWNCWSSNCVGGSARTRIDALAHTHYFDSRISVIMSINILLKHVSDLNN